MGREHGMSRVVAALCAACSIALLAPLPATATQVLSHGPRMLPVVALTIDDGYSPTACRAMFEILERRHVVATFFPVAQAMTADRALWREIATRNYPIGNHTANHTYLAGKSLAAQQAAIAAGRAQVRAIIGRAPIRVLRPPAAEWDGTTVTAASRVGEQLVLLWDTTFGDTGRHPVEARVIANATRGRSGSVILMHCNRPFSAQVLERVIDAYQARGFEFVTVPQLFGLKGPVPTYAPFPTPAELARFALRTRTVNRMAWALA